MIGKVTNMLHILPKDQFVVQGSLLCEWRVLILHPHAWQVSVRPLLRYGSSHVTRRR